MTKFKLDKTEVDIIKHRAESLGRFIVDEHIIMRETRVTRTMLDSMLDVILSDDYVDENI